MSRNHSHYYKSVAHLSEIDVYRVLDLFKVTHPAIAHAIKKLLLPGGRGAGKEYEKDLREAVDSINRALQMIAEDCNVGMYPQPAPKPTETIALTVDVKVDPAVDLLAQAVELLKKLEAAEVTGTSAVQIHARALLRKIENTEFKVLDRNEAAAAQGFDLVAGSNEICSFQHMTAQGAKNGN